MNLISEVHEIGRNIHVALAGRFMELSLHFCEVILPKEYLLSCKLKTRF
jgi:hypothetical protein